MNHFLNRPIRFGWTQHSLIAVSALLLALPFSASASGFYKWVDEHGVTQYADSPPADKNIESSRIKPTGLKVRDREFERAQERLDGNRDGYRQSAKARSENEALENEPANRQEKLAGFCKDARRNLKTLNENARVREKDPKSGEMRVVPEEQRQSKLAETKKQIKEYCN